MKTARLSLPQKSRSTLFTGILCFVKQGGRAFETMKAQLFWGCLFFAATQAVVIVRGATTYNVTDLGSGTAYGINISGKVVGDSAAGPYLSEGTNKTIVPVPQKLLGDPDHVLNLLADMGTARAINDAGLVVGGAWLEDFLSYQVPTVGAGTNGFIPPLNGTAVAVSDEKVVIQDRGTLAGQTVMAGGAIFDLRSQTFFRVAFFPTAISKSNVVVGFSGSYTHAPQIEPVFPNKPWMQIGTNAQIMIIPATIADPDVSSIFQGGAYGINSAGLAVGWVTGPKSRFINPLQNNGYYNGFVWSGGSNVTLIQTLGGLQSEARAINDHGTIVGMASLVSNERHAIIADAGAEDSSGMIPVTDLNTLISAGSGWVLSGATAINAVGQIIGQGTYLGEPHAFLLTPRDLDLAGAYLKAGWFSGITIDGNIGETFAIQYKENALDPEWLPADSVILSSTSQEWADLSSAQRRNRNYRAVKQPAGLATDYVSHAVFGFTITGLVGRSYRVQYKASPSDLAWQDAGTIVLTNIAQSWIDLDWDKHAGRIYRTVSQP